MTPLNEIMRAFIPPILRPIVEAGVEVAITPEGFQLGGFYKHGTVLLRPTVHNTDEPPWDVIGRYGKLDTIHNTEELVARNYDEWLTYRARFDDWSSPAAGWAELMTRYSLVERRETVRIEYIAKGGE